MFKSRGDSSAFGEERPIFALDDRCQRSRPGQMNVVIPYVPDSDSSYEYDVSGHFEM